MNAHLLVEATGPMSANIRTPQKPCLLVVDDEIDQLESFRNYFSRRNFLVLITTDGEEAIYLIQEGKPDLVFLDIELSKGMNGKEILRLLREYDSNTKVVMITATLLTNQEKQEFMKLGVIECLTKPVTYQALEALIRKETACTS